MRPREIDRPHLFAPLPTDHDRPIGAIPPEL